jgi:PAS domain S-box-containing protein/putative nucleotidyltransferase with HDIG domain
MIQENSQKTDIPVQSDLRSHIANTLTTIVDRNYIYTNCNTAYCQAVNRTTSEIIGHSVAEIWGAKQFATMIKHRFEECFSGQEVHDFVWLNIPSQGWRYSHVHYLPYLDATGAITHAIVITLDITAQTRTESEIQLLAKFPNENPNPVMRIASEGAIIYANSASHELLDYWGCKLDELLPLDLRKLVIECREAGQSRNLNLDINGRFFTFTLLPVVDAGHVNIYGRDISAQIQAERRYHVLFDNAPNAIVVADRAGIIQQVNQRVEALFGHTRSELLGEHIDILIPENLRERHHLHHDKFYIAPNERKDDLGIELTALHKSGEIIPVEISLSALDTPEGQLATVIIRDIRARKQAESEIVRLSQVVEETADAVVITDRDGVIQYVNPAFELMSGYSSAESVGNTPRIVKSDKQGAAFFEILWGTILQGDAFRATIINQKKNGELFYVDQAINPICDEKGIITHFVSTAKDITERIKAEDEIRRRAAHFEALHRIDVAISGSMDIDVTLNILIEQVVRQLDVNAAMVSIFNPLSLRLEAGVNTGFINPNRYISNQSPFAKKIIAERMIISIPKLIDSAENEVLSHLLHQELFVSYFGIPLIAKGEMQGVLELFTRKQIAADTSWLDLLRAMATQAAIAINNASLFVNLERSNFELAHAYDITLEGWARALELRDQDTIGHTRRVTALTEQLARKIGYSSQLLTHLRRGALLHDIGKMGIPDRILHKPGKLTEEEWEIMRQHPVLAHEMLSPIRFLHPALDIPYCHHEKWDGSGYPRGLSGEEIPLAARIFAIIDVWDALTSDRPYRAAWSREKTKTHIRSQSGHHFDPQVVSAFFKLDILFSEDLSD